MLSLPDQFELFSDIKKEGFLAIKEEKEKGKKLVGIFCSYTPVELVTAAGAYYVSLCGSDQKSVEYGEQVLPKSLCPLIKASYGAANSQTCPYFFFSDAVIGETTCDGKKKMRIDVKCDGCNGQGKLWHIRGRRRTLQPCQECHGKGTRSMDKICEECGGSGKLR